MSNESLSFYPKVTVDLGIKQFKKMVRARYYLPSLQNRLIKDFKQRQWKMYHEIFPSREILDENSNVVRVEDNSSVPSHSHAIDKLVLM